MLKRFFCLMISMVILISGAHAEEWVPSCKSALLMDFDSGKILYEFNPHEKLAPASVTKVMTMLIAMEEIESGRLNYTDVVTASAYAKSMGGSTIFLDEGEKITVNDLLKGIAVASGNDACVAIAEHISGNCTDFVNRMNERAKELGMNNTHFVNCNGLDDANHYSTAYDIALMSRELMKHEDIFKYTTIWMDSLRGGAFTLSNTNKLVRFYDGCTGLKTGSTSQAGFCISATAKREDMHLIAVIMKAPTSKERQKDASTLLNYGFGKYKNNIVLKKGEIAENAVIEKGKKSHVGLVCKTTLKYISEKTDSEDIEIKYNISKDINAPVKKGEIAGEAICYKGREVVGKTELLFNENVEKIDFSYSYGKIIDTWLGNKNQFR